MKENFNFDKNAVKCRLCKSFVEATSVCDLKNKTVRPNKKRYCGTYISDAERLIALTTSMISKPVPTQRGIVNRQQLRSYKKDIKLFKKSAIQDKESFSSSSYNIADSPSFPMTGDLSRFKTTAPPLSEEVSK